MLELCDAVGMVEDCIGIEILAWPFVAAVVLPFVFIID
jgi:hypothetical protein